GVAWRGEGSSGSDLWRVWHARTFELTGLEKSIEKNFQPFLYRRQIVFISVFSREGVRPDAFCLVAPRGVTQECDLARAIAVPSHIVEVEVLQFVRADLLFGALRRSLAIAFLRNQLGGNFGVDNGLEDLARCLVELSGRDNPADQVLNQGLWHRRVYIVVRHVIADAVRSPAEGQLAKIGRAQDDRFVQVCQSEQV